MVLKIWGLPWDVVTEHIEEDMLTCGYLDPDNKRIVIRDDAGELEAYGEIIRLMFVIRRLGMIKPGWEHVSHMLALKHIARQMEGTWAKRNKTKISW